MSELLNAEAIKQVDDQRMETVAVPEWQGKVNVRNLTNEESTEFEQFCTDCRKNGKINLKGVKVALVVRAACDDCRAPIFGKDDAAWLEKKSGAALNRVFQAAQRINGFTKTDIEELAGNS